MLFSNINLSDFAPFLELWIGTYLLLLYQVVQKRILFNKSKINTTQNIYLDIERRFNEKALQYQGLLNTNNHFDYYAYYLIRLKRITITFLVFGLFVLLCMGVEKSNNQILYIALLIIDLSVIIYLFTCIIKYRIIKKRFTTVFFVLFTIICVIITIYLLGAKQQDNQILLFKPFVILFTILICVIYPFIIYLISLYDSYWISKAEHRLDELERTIDWLFKASVNPNAPKEDIPKLFRKKIDIVTNNNQPLSMFHFNKYIVDIVKEEYNRLVNSWCLDTIEEVEEDFFSDRQIQQIKQIINDCITRNTDSDSDADSEKS